MEEKRKEIPGTYDSLEILYTTCAQKGIETALEHAWKGSKDYEELGGSYGVLRKIDRKNTQNHNQDPKNEKIRDITDGSPHYNGLDIQACNKVILFLKAPREKIFQFYKLDNNLWNKCTTLAREMNELRNKYYHKTGQISYDERQQKLIELVRKMEEMIGMLYSNVTNDKGIPYLTTFAKERLMYESEQLKKKYYLSDYLDLTKYDVTKFFTACAELDIRDPGKEDGRLYFYSTDLTKDLKLLKNYLSLHDESKVTPEAPNASTASQVEGIGKKWLKYIVPAILILVLLIFGAVLTTIGRFFGKDNGDTQQDMMENAQSMLEDMMNNGPVETADPNSKNQIPAEYEQDVKILQGADPLKLDNMTLEVEVGAFVAPRAAGTWRDGVLYSQDTDIAKPDGQVLLGVAPGETFVVYAKGSLVEVYRVVVSEPEPTVSADSKNQVPPKYEQDIQMLQVTGGQRLDLMTLTVKVGENTTPREAGTWRDGVIYSQNTDIAKPDDLLIRGIAPGETYVIYEYNGLVTAYRVVVTE